MSKITVAIAGLGSRGLQTYAKCLEKFADRAEIVAVADIRPDRVAVAAEKYNIPADKCFDSVESMLQQPKLADLLLICTPDDVHYQPAMDGLKRGYHLLLEKPAARSVKECRDIARLAEEKGLNVVVCHVLRYTVFYQKIKELIDAGRVGDIMNIEAIERVGYWHQAHSFVRGNWRNDQTTSPMIMQKCCHDLDYLVWLSGQRCERVSSFGSLKLFKPECAPEGAALRCMDGCKAKESCPFDAEKIYLTNEKTGVLAGNKDWPLDVLALDPTEESIREAIKTGPYGRCVYHCDNNVVDHQVVSMQMENGATLTLTMCAFTTAGSRALTIMGTKGDIRADMSANTIRVCAFGGEPEVIDVTKIADDFSGHGGGDKQLVAQFIDIVNGKEPDSRVTTLEASVESHLVALAAEESRKNGGKSIEIAPMRG